MKKVFIVLCFSFLLLNCSSDKENGPQISILQDIDGNQYNAVKIGSQTWMQQSLNVSQYKNGDPIPQVQNPQEWYNLTTGAWCYYNHETENGTVYGKLYNWHAVNDPRGLAPEGWHVPSFDEWTLLRNSLGNDAQVGAKMKATGTTLWLSPNAGATNSSYFTALPSGYRSNNGDFYESLGMFAFYWSSTQAENSDDCYSFDIFYNDTILFQGTYPKQMGYAVRCVKDSE